jgi:hypothetical protein
MNWAKFEPTTAKFDADVKEARFVTRVLATTAKTTQETAPEPFVRKSITYRRGFLKGVKWLLADSCMDQQGRIYPDFKEAVFLPLLEGGVKWLLADSCIDQRRTSSSVIG